MNTDLLRAHGHLRDMSKSANAQAKQLKDELRVLTDELYEAMEAEDIQSTQVGSTLYTRTEGRIAYVNDQEAFNEWAEANEPELIAVKERQGLLSSLVRERDDNNEPQPPGVTMLIQHKIQQHAR